MPCDTSGEHALPIPLVPPNGHERIDLDVDRQNMENNTADYNLLPFSELDGSHSMDFIDALLQRLRVFPTVVPLRTLAFIPKSYSRRYAKLATSVIEW